MPYKIMDSSFEEEKWQVWLIYLYYFPWVVLILGNARKTIMQELPAWW